MAGKTKEGQGANKAPSQGSAVAEEMAWLTQNYSAVDALRRLAKIAALEVPREWGPMAMLFRSIPAFPASAAQIFYACYTGITADTVGDGYDEYSAFEDAVVCALENHSRFQECAARTEGDAVMSLEFARKVMHDLVLSYAKDLSSQEGMRYLHEETERYGRAMGISRDEATKEALATGLCWQLNCHGLWNFEERVSRSISGAMDWLGISAISPRAEQA